MTKNQIDELISSGKKRKCNACGENKPVTEFFIKKDKSKNRHYRFNSPCKKCSNIKSPERKEYEKGYQLKRKYSLSPVDYKKKLNAQQGLCYICGKKYTRSLAVDHCHHSGKFRGLLCTKCNMGLGYFKDDVTTLHKAIEYLNHTKRPEKGSK